MPKKRTEPGDLWDRMIRAMRSAPGSSTPDRRAAVLGRIVDGAATEMSPALERFVDQIASASYQVTEEHIGALRKAGLSDGAILELTLTAAAASAHRGVLAVRRALQSQETKEVHRAS